MRVQRIPLADEPAVAALAGRKAKEWARCIEVSLWQSNESSPSVEALAEIARCASRAQWRSKTVDESDESDESDGVARGPYWSTDEAIAAARRVGYGGDVTCEKTEGGEGGEGGHSLVEVELREVWYAAASHGSTVTPAAEGSRAYSYRITFSRRGKAHTSQVTKGDIALWQARVREALMQWAAQDGGFELR